MMILMIRSTYIRNLTKYMILYCINHAAEKHIYYYDKRLNVIYLYFHIQKKLSENVPKTLHLYLFRSIRKMYHIYLHMQFFIPLY